MKNYTGLIDELEILFLTAEEQIPNEVRLEIALYTVQKINNYPREYGKTIENYFDVLYQDEIKAYMNRKQINQISQNLGSGYMTKIIAE